MITLVDKIALDAADVKKTADGYVVAYPRVARTGIQIYAGSELGLKDVEQVRVYRPEAEVFSDATMRSFAHRPVTLEHPPVLVDAGNWNKYSRGHTGDEITRDGDTIRVPMMMMDASAIKAFEGGKRELSMGYTCDVKFEAGMTDRGEQYDAIQTNIRANHLAVVAAARGGPTLRIGDNQGVQEMEKQIMVDGVTLTMSDTAAQVVSRAIANYDQQIKKLTDEMSEYETEEEKKKKKMEEDSAAKDAALAKAQAEVASRDAEIVDLKKKLADSEITPEKIEAAAREQQKVDAATKALVGDAAFEQLKGKPLADVRKAVVLHIMKDTAKDYTADQFRIAFDALAQRTESQQPQRSVDGGATLIADSFALDKKVTDERATAYQDYVKDLQNAWKNPAPATKQ